MNARRRAVVMAGAIAFPLALLLLWEWAAQTGRLQPTFFPPPSRIYDSFVRLWEQGVVTSEGFVTVSRMMVGWAIAGIVGVSLGCLLGRVAWLRTALWPVLEFLRAIPAVAIVPIGLLLLGVGASTEIVVVTFAATWPVLINTTATVAATDPLLVDTARVFGLSRTREIFSVQLPDASPAILAALRTSLSIALIVAVVAEMIASAGGLGAEIIQARSRYRMADVYAIVAVLGVIGVVTNAGLSAVERRLTRWQRPPPSVRLGAPRSTRLDTHTVP